jgi:GNAT superfamily N-acetyltransferase
MTRAKVYVAKRRGRLLASFSLSKRKPWAIDTSYFAPCKLAVYLTAMAVSPNAQKAGIGSLCVDEAIRRARAWHAGAIRLDAYDTAGGAGGFYVKCGFREVGNVIYRKTPLVYLEMRFDPL